MIIALPLNQNQKTFLFEDDKLIVTAKINITKLKTGYYSHVSFMGFYNHMPCHFTIINYKSEDTTHRCIEHIGEWAGICQTDILEFKINLVDRI